jgi:RHS repeat-associated protein
LSQDNGNIAGYRYRTRGRTAQTYAFSYDGLNRLESADYAQDQPGGGYEADAYNTNYSYDVRGNILSIQRNGKAQDADGCFQTGQIDNLTMSYGSGTNKLKRVTDAVGSTLLGKTGFTKVTSAPNVDCQYDANGNLIYDPAKELTIYYNYLNLPERFEFEDCRTVEVTYDAVGNKLATITQNGTQTARERIYIGGIEYVNGRLESIAHVEGRTYYDGTESRLEFNLTDHLGNVRAVFSDLNENGQVDLSANTESSEMLMENNYYPFGMKMNGGWQEDKGRATNYRYNGKEFSEELGLYDYGARWYDPAIGRWNAVDPLASDYAAWSPYNYVMGNPVKFIDPDGMRVDNTIFADNDGNILSMREDDLDDAIVIISDENLSAFHQGEMKANMQSGGAQESDIADLRGLGDSYMVDGLESIFDASMSSPLSSEDHRYVDSDGRPLENAYPEAKGYFNISEDGKTLTIDPSSVKASGSVSAIALGGSRPAAHSHPIHGGLHIINGAGGVSGPAREPEYPSPQDHGNNSGRQKYNPTRYKDAVIGPNNIYLYGKGGSTGKFPRSFFKK